MIKITLEIRAGETSPMRAPIQKRRHLLLPWVPVSLVGSAVSENPLLAPHRHSIFTLQEMSQYIL